MAALQIKPASPVYTVCDSQSIILVGKIWSVCSIQPVGLRKPPRLREKTILHRISLFKPRHNNSGVFLLLFPAWHRGGVVLAHRESPAPQEH